MELENRQLKVQVQDYQEKSRKRRMMQAYETTGISQSDLSNGITHFREQSDVVSDVLSNMTGAVRPQIDDRSLLSGRSGQDDKKQSLFAFGTGVSSKV